MQTIHEFIFNFREIMSKMREFVYFETIFVNSATPVIVVVTGTWV